MSLSFAFYWLTGGHCAVCLLQGEFLVNAGSFGITTTISGISNVSVLSTV